MAQLSITKSYEYVHELVNDYLNIPIIRSNIGTIKDLMEFVHKNNIKVSTKTTVYHPVYKYVITKDMTFLNSTLTKSFINDFLEPLIPTPDSTNFESKNNPFGPIQLIHILHKKFEGIKFTIDNMHPLVWACDLNNEELVSLMIKEYHYNQYDYDGNILKVNKSFLYPILVIWKHQYVQELKPTGNELVFSKYFEKHCDKLFPDDQTYEWTDEVYDKHTNTLIDIIRNKKKDHLSKLFKTYFDIGTGRFDGILVECVSFLQVVAHYNIDLNIPTKNGSYFLQYVIQRGFWILAQELVGKGAKIYDDDGKLLTGVKDNTILTFIPTYKRNEEHFKMVGEFLAKNPVKDKIVTVPEPAQVSAPFSKMDKDDKKMAKKMFIKELVKKHFETLTIGSFD